MKLVPYEENLCSKYAKKMLSIKINDVCNANCPFCVDRDGRGFNSIDVSATAEATIINREFRDIIITGGEPFLDFDKVLQLIKAIRPHKDRIVLNTNGSLLTREYAKSLNGLIDEIQVSIHHYDNEKSNSIFGINIPFENIKYALTERDFIFSVNSTFNNTFSENEKKDAVDKMIDLCVHYLGADRLRLTELKKVDGSQFVDARDFFPKDNKDMYRDTEDLITKGCTVYFKKKGVDVSVKRLCEYAKGKDSENFSCCFIDVNGQKKIDVDTDQTFKVVYGDGKVTNDWIFNPKK